MNSQPSRIVTASPATSGSMIAASPRRMNATEMPINIPLAFFANAARPNPSPAFAAVIRPLQSRSLFKDSRTIDARQRSRWPTIEIAAILLPKFLASAEILFPAACPTNAPRNCATVRGYLISGPSRDGRIIGLSQAYWEGLDHWDWTHYCVRKLLAWGCSRGGIYGYIVGAGGTAAGASDFDSDSYQSFHQRWDWASHSGGG